ncbi:unnamed protein product [Absidia cylindrospora]
MKIKNNSGLLSGTTFTTTTIHDTKLAQHVTSTPVAEKPRRQTAAQRRAALLAQKTILSNKDTNDTTVEATATPPTPTITTETPSSPPLSSSPLNEEEEKKDTPSPSQQQHEMMPTPPLSPSLESCSVASLEANARILAVKRDGNLKAVMMEFTAMKKQGLPLTHHTYNLVLDAYATLRREGSPLAPMLRVYDEMVRSHIQPSSYTYTLLLRTLCRRDVEVQKTVAMLKRQSARTGQLVQDIGVLESEANLDKAMNLFGDATQAQHTQVFEVDLFNQLLRVLSHYGDTTHALQVFHELDQFPMPLPMPPPMLRLSICLAVPVISKLHDAILPCTKNTRTPWVRMMPRMSTTPWSIPISSVACWTVPCV